MPNDVTVSDSAKSEYSVKDFKIPNDPNLSFTQKVEIMAKLYQEYEEAISAIYEEFLMKLADIRKKDDIKKLDNINLKGNNNTNA